MIRICSKCERMIDTDTNECEEINGELVCEHCLGEESYEKE